METDQKDKENKNLGENAEVDREQLISDDRDQDKSEAFEFMSDRDQHHLLIAIKVDQN